MATKTCTTVFSSVRAHVPFRNQPYSVFSNRPRPLRIPVQVTAPPPII